MKQQGNIFKKKSFTLVELLVVIAIIAILAGLLLPSLMKARMKVEATSCVNNCKQIGGALLQYSNDFNDWIVPSSLPSIASWNGAAYNSCPWMLLLGKFGPYSPCDYGIRITSLGIADFTGITGTRIMCPAQKESGKFTYSDYAANVWLFGSVGSSTYKTHKISQIKSPSIAKYVLDNARTDNYGVSYVFSGSNFMVDFRHIRRTNVLYSDGHVNSAKCSDLAPAAGGGSTELSQGF